MGDEKFMTLELVSSVEFEMCVDANIPKNLKN
jgi:hypothetical protein